MQTPWILIGVVFVATAYAVLKCDEDDSLCISMARADDDNSTECEGMAKCFSDDDCHGGTCLGIAVGKCNCGGCLSLLPCEDDSSCGGLKGACDTKKKTCDCDAGFKANGFDSYFDALLKFCNVEECSDNSCYGLACNSGLCSCPLST